MGWNELGDVTVECRQNGVDASETGRGFFEKCSGHDSGNVVEAFVGVGFPAREAVIGATKYSTHEVVAKGAGNRVSSEGDRRCRRRCLA